MKLTIACLAAVALLIFTPWSSARGDGGMQGMSSPVSEGELGQVSVGHSLLNLNSAQNTTTQTNNDISLDNGSTITNGNIKAQVNANRGITNAFFNTGNVVSMSNSTIVNVILNNKVGASVE